MDDKTTGKADYRGVLADAVILFRGEASERHNAAADREGHAADLWKAWAPGVAVISQRQLKAWGDAKAQAATLLIAADVWNAAAEHLAQKLAHTDAVYAAGLRAELARLFPEQQQPDDDGPRVVAIVNNGARCWLGQGGGIAWDRSNAQRFGSYAAAHAAGVAQVSSVNGTFQIEPA